MVQRDARERLRGIILLLISVSLFSAVDGVSKILAETQSVGQIVRWARYVFALPVFLATYRPAEWARLLQTAAYNENLTRFRAAISRRQHGVGGSLSAAFRGDSYSVSPRLSWSLRCPALFLGSGRPCRVGSGVWSASAVIFVARPGFGELSKFSIFPLAAAVFYALFQLLTAQLAAAGETADTTLAWTLAVGVVVSSPIAAFAWAPVSPTKWLLMIALGVLFGLARRCWSAPSLARLPVSWLHSAISPDHRGDHIRRDRLRCRS